MLELCNLDFDTAYPYGLTEKTQFKNKDFPVGRLFPPFTQYCKRFIETRSISETCNCDLSSNIKTLINQPGRGAKDPLQPPCPTLPSHGIFNFLVLHLYFMKNKYVMTFCKIYLGLILWIFFQNLNWFLQCHHFFTTWCYFLCMSSVGITNITLKTLVIFEPRRFRKNLYWLL